MTLELNPLGRPEPTTVDQRRALAMRRIRAKRDLRIHLVVYLAVNMMLTTLWLIGGGSTNFFWPIYSILGWGLGVAIHGYIVHVSDTPTEDQIQREMRRLP